MIGIQWVVNGKNQFLRFYADEVGLTQLEVAIRAARKIGASEDWFKAGKIVVMSIPVTHDPTRGFGDPNAGGALVRDVPRRVRRRNTHAPRRRSR